MLKWEVANPSDAFSRSIAWLCWKTHAYPARAAVVVKQLLKGSMVEADGVFIAIDK